MTGARMRHARRLWRARRHSVVATITTLAVTVTGLVLVTAPPAMAAATVFTWTGNAEGDTSWANGSNWSGHVAPNGSAAIVVNSGSGTMTNNLNPANVSIEELNISGTWVIQGAQIDVKTQINIVQGSDVEFRGGLSGSRLDLSVGTFAAYGATVDISGPLDISDVLRVQGWDPDVSSVYLDGTAANHANKVSVSSGTVYLGKPAGVPAARRVDAVGTGTVKWTNDRQLQDVTAPTGDSPLLSQPTMSAEYGGRFLLDGHEEVTSQVVLEGGSQIDLGGGTLTAETLRSGLTNGGRTDLKNGTFRFSATPRESTSNTVSFGDRGDPVDLHLDAKLLGAQPLVVEGGGAQIPVIRLADADGYTGALTTRYPTVCAAKGMGGTVTESGGVYIDERSRVCQASTPPPTPVPPGTPVNFTAAPDDGRVSLSWERPADTGSEPLQGYHLSRATGGNEGGLISTLGPDETSFNDVELENGTQYTYAISAFSTAGESNQAYASATPQGTQVPPGPPTLAALVGDGAVRLEWSTPADPGNMTLTGYVLYRSTSDDSRGNEVYSGTDRAHLDTGLDNGTTYYYSVVPHAGETQGQASNRVTAKPSVDAGVLALAIQQTGPAYPGRDTTLEIRATNKSDQALDGPLVATVMLPDEVFEVASAGGSGWTCGEPRSLGGRSLLTCTNQFAVQAMADAVPLPITLSVPAGAARASYPVSYSMAAAGRAASSNQPYQLIVSEPKPAHLAVSVAVPESLTAEEPQDLTVQVGNDGGGSTLGPLTLALPVPAGVTVDNLRTSSFWSCTLAAAAITCSSDELMPAGASAPAIVVAAKAPPTAEPTTYLLTATARSTGALGPVEGSATGRTAAPVIPKPTFSVSPNEVDGGAMQLSVENTSVVSTTGKVSFRLTLPSSVEVQQLNAFGTWSCEQRRVVFTCDNPTQLTLAPGASIDGPLLSATSSYAPPGSGGVVVTLTGQYAGSAAATVLDLDGLKYMTPSTPVPIPVFAPKPNPVVSVEAQFQDSPLFGLHHSSVTFSLKGNPNGASSAVGPFVLLLPKSLVVDGTAIPSMAGYPAGTPAPSCEMRPGNYPGGYTTAVVCLQDRPVPAGSLVNITVPFTAVQDLGGTVSALTGIVRRPAGLTTPTEIIDYAWGRVRSRGGAALASSSEARVNGITFTVSAGPPQRVDAGVLSADGTVAPTRVVMAGSSSAESIRALTFGWVQTAGPKVTWQDGPVHNGGAAPYFPQPFPVVGGTVPVPDARGKDPSFLAPLVTEHTELVFELYVTDGKAVFTAVTTIAVDPLADNPPSVASVKLTNPGGTVLNPAVAPSAGQELQLRYLTTDVERDPVAVVPSVVRPGELRNTTFTPVAGAPAGQSWFSFTWPAGVSQAVIEAVLTDGKTDPFGNAVASRHSLVIGPDPAPLGISLAPPTTGIDPGGSLNLTATLTNPVVGGDTTDVTWTQLSGPTATITPTGATASVRAPPNASPGDSITVQALARRGTGSSAPIAKATVTIAVVALPALGLGPVRTTSGALPASVSTGSTTPLTLTVNGGRAPYSYAWQIVSGGGSLTGATAAAASFTAPGSPALTSVAVTVTDASGTSARQTAAIAIGTLPGGTLGAQGCDAGGPLRTIYDAAAGLAGSDHVSVKFGALNVDLGPKSTLLGGATTCSTATLTIVDGSATVSGIGFTGVNGSVNALGITISSATVTLPAAWRLIGVQLRDVRFNFTDYALSGYLTASTLPVVSSTGAVTQATTTLTLGAGRVTLSASAKLAGASVSLAGVYCFAGGAAWANPPAGVAGPVPAGAFAIHATAGDLRFLGHTLTGGGDLTLAANGTLTGAVELAWTGAPSGDLGVNEVRVRWSDTGLRFHAGANLGGRFAASLDGDYLDEDDWSADVSGGLSANWTPAPGLALTKYNAATNTGTGVEGSVAMKGGELSWAVTLRAGATWSTGPLTVRDVSLTLGSGTAAPAGCRLTAAQQQSLYLDLKGIAEVAWGATGGSGGTKVSLNVETCIVPDVGWTLTTTAPLSGVQIVNGLDLTGVTFTASHRNSPDQTSYVLNATGTAFGVSGAVTLALLSPAAGDATYLADMMVDLDDLGLPVSGEGHLLYASRPIPDLGVIAGFDGGFATHATSGGTGSGGCAGATPGKPLDGLPVAAGFTALANFKMPTSLCGFLSGKVGVPVAPSLVVSVNMSGTPVITASISTGPQGIKIFSTDDGTTLTLKRIRLSISLGGSFGLMADADLALANPTKPTETTVLQLGAGVTIQLAGVPSFTVVLQKTGDAWDNAFGVPGLKLGDLAIQGGIVFSAIPTPSIGFGAQILDMPTSWKNTLGIIPTSTGAMERVQLVLNISLSNPILDISLGTHDGHDFMRPLRPISTSIENALRIDYAQLVIAPFGGDVGPFHYDPGFHLGFAMTVVGVKVEVRADVDMGSGTIGAHAKIGAFQFGPVAMDDTTFDLVLSPANGGLTVGFSSGIRIGPIRTTATASVQARVAGTTPVLKVDFDARLGNVPFGLFSLDNLQVFAHTNLTGAAAIANPLNGIVFGGTATLRVLTIPMTVYGSITMSTWGGITGGDLLVTNGAFTVGPATVRGSGCNTSVLGFLPAGFSVPSNGPCLQVGLHPGSANPYYVKASGTLSVAGLTASFDGQIDNTGIAINKASIQVGPAATVSVKGRLWAGPGINGTQKDYDPTKKTNVTVRNGDFRVSGNSSVNLALFRGNISFDFGNVGGSQWVIGSAKFDALKGSGSPLYATASLYGSFNRNSSGFHWDLAADGDLYVVGINDTAYKLVGVHLQFTETKFLVSGSLRAGPVNAFITASLYMSNGLRYSFSGGGDISVLNFKINATVSLSNTSGYVVASAIANVDVGVFKVRGFATFSTSGAICVGGSANVGGGDTKWPELVAGTAHFCTRDMPGLKAGVHADFRVLKMFSLYVNWTNLTTFKAIGGFSMPYQSWGWIGCFVACFGAEAGFGGYVYLGVASSRVKMRFGGVDRTIGPGVSAAASAELSLKGCLAICFGVSVGFLVQFNPTKFCGSWAGATACLGFNPFEFDIDY